MTGESVAGGRPDPRPDREPGRPPSGLRDPPGAVRGMAAGALLAETVALLLAIQPIRVLGGHRSGAAVGFVAAAAVASVLLVALLRRRSAWLAASALQVALFAGGLIMHPVLVALGILFGLVWLYLWHVRRTVLGPPRG